MINKLWIFFILIGISYSFITGNIEIINNEIINSCNTSLKMMMDIFAVMALWLGLMNIAKESGLLQMLSCRLSKILHFLFPEVPKNHESLSFIASNMIANIFGLGSAATPFGLKAMKSLQEINKDKTVASRSMITFLVINTSGLTIIPTTVISLRLMHKSVNPAEIVIATVLATICSTLGGIMMDHILSRWYK